MGRYFKSREGLKKLSGGSAMNILKALLSLYLVFAVILSQFFAAYLFSKGRTSYRKAFSALVLCISIYLLGYLMIINNNNLQEMIFESDSIFGITLYFCTMAYGGSPYTKTIFSLKSGWHFAFSVPVITFFIRLTNVWHHFLYKMGSKAAIRILCLVYGKRFLVLY